MSHPTQLYDRLDACSQPTAFGESRPSVTFQFAIDGFTDDSPCDPVIVTSAACPLDRPVLPGPVAKERREDLQVMDYLAGLSLQGIARHPLVFGPGEDPPDRRLGHGSDVWGLELTELTVQDARATIAPMRNLGRELADRLRADEATYGHLVDREIDWTIIDGPVTADTLEDVAVALKEDRGVVKNPQLGSDGRLPETLDVSSGAYMDLPGGGILVRAKAQPGPVSVTVSTTLQLHRSEAVDLLIHRISMKDKPGNRALLMTCSLPDAFGHACPLDAWLFDLMVEHDLATHLPAPTHLDYVTLTLWGTGRSVELFKRQSPPWLLPS